MYHDQNFSNKSRYLILQVPLCELDSEKSQIEESIVRWANFKVIDAEKNLKTDAIKLFAVRYFLNFDYLELNIPLVISLLAEMRWRPGLVN